MTTTTLQIKLTQIEDEQGTLTAEIVGDPSMREMCVAYLELEKQIPEDVRNIIRQPATPVPTNRE